MSGIGLLFTVRMTLCRIFICATRDLFLECVVCVLDLRVIIIM